MSDVPWKPAINRGRVWFEVWPRRWGRYEVWECDEVLGAGRKYLRATVWGRERAFDRAEALQAAHDAPPDAPRALFTTRHP